MAAPERDRPDSRPDARKPSAETLDGREDTALRPGQPTSGDAFEVSFESGPLQPRDDAPVTSSLVLEATPKPGAEPAVPGSQRGTVVVSQASRPSRPSQPSRARVVTRSFADGVLLAGRFRIARFLGEGGMGEVYEAEDLELRERVALKTVRPEIAGDPRAWEEFRREVHLARKVTHPNVCRIFDVFHHYDPHDGEVDVAFVTMELLPGETLQARLKREGRLTPQVVLPIARQMAAGLGAAHARGVVHRDFKGANVMLVPAEDGSGGVRAVVTDFGLARGEAGGDESFGSLHTAGRIAGTPAYMAPEQLTGGKVTPAIDVYALGVVLFELLTGRPPFVGDSPMTTAVMRLKENPPLPRTLAPDLERRWELVLLRCLEREPSARFAAPADAVAALEDGRGQGLSITLSTAALRANRRAVIAVVAGGALLLALAGVWFAQRRARPVTAEPAPSAGAPAVTVRPTVAVMGFKNLAQRSAVNWVSTAVAEMLATDLGAGGHLRLLPLESVARAKQELSLPDLDSYSPETLTRLRGNLGSDWVVSGMYLAQDGSSEWRLDVRLQDARSGEVVETMSARGPESDLAGLVTSCGQKLRAKLGVGEAQAPEVAAARASFSSNPTWTRLYAEGLEKLRHHDAPEARALFERAVQADPQQALGHSWLAAAWDRLGYKLKARDAAKRALDLAGSLPREEALLVAARYHGYNDDRQEAIEKYRTLWTFRPDDVDYGLGLVDALIEGRDGPGAQAVLDALRRLPPPAGNDVRIDLADADLASKVLSEYARAVQLAEQAAVKGNAAGARLLVAEARSTQAMALLRMGDAAQAKARAAEARTLYEAAGDRGGAADATMIVGHVLFLVERNLDAAEKHYATVLSEYRAMGDQGNVAATLSASAGVLQARGDLDGARRLSEQVVAAFRDVGDAANAAAGLTNLGQLDLQVGQPEVAQRRLVSAVALFRTNAWRTGEAAALQVLGEVQRVRGDLAAARASFERALALQTESGERVGAALSGAQLAALLLDEGRLADAEPAAQAAADKLHELGGGPSEAIALEVVARARLLAGQTDRARQALQLAETRDAQGDPAQQLMRAITAARIEAAAGQRDAALGQLRDAAEKARAQRLFDAHFEARLALGELGGGGLAVLAREARTRGYALIAKRAEAARRPSAAR